MASVAKHIRKLRLERGLTQEELAERLHVTRQAVSNWERSAPPSRIWTPSRPSPPPWGWRSPR